MTRSRGHRRTRSSTNLEDFSLLRLSKFVATCALVCAASQASAAGNLNIYNWGDYTSPQLVKKFEQTYNVKVTVTDFDSNDTALAKARQGATGFDVMVTSQAYLPTYIKEGLLAETNPGKMENSRNIGAIWKDPAFDSGRKYSVPYFWYTSGVTVNSTAYNGDINSWKILFDPPAELRGKINIVPEMNDLLFAALAYSGAKWCTADRDVLKKVRDMLVEAKKNWISIDYAGLDKLVTKDVLASLDWNGSELRRKFGGASFLKYGLPKEGFTYGSDNLVVLKDAPNMENAKLFQNFIMAPENAALMTDFNKYPTAIDGAEKFVTGDLKNVPEFAISAEEQARGTPLRLCDPDTERLYTRIWEDVRH